MMCACLSAIVQAREMCTVGEWWCMNNMNPRPVADICYRRDMTTLCEIVLSRPPYISLPPSCDDTASDTAGRMAQHQPHHLQTPDAATNFTYITVETYLPL